MKKRLLNIIITIIIGAIYFYFSLPPINVTSFTFWFFVIMLLVIYMIINNSTIILSNYLKRTPEKSKEADFIVIGIFASIIIIGVINLILSPLFNSQAYYKRIAVQNDSTFTEDVEPVNFKALPIIDKASSQRLGDRVMGQMPELVSQFNVSNLYTQINYNSDIVRVTPLEYSDFFKYLNNRKDGVKGYITVNSVSGEANLVKLEQGMKYMDSAIFSEDLNRKLRFSYPTKILGGKSFEIDNEGNPYWIVPTIKYHGINIRPEIENVIILDPITGNSNLYDLKDVPEWVDHAYPASLILEQVNDWGKYKNGFFNSIFGQKEVVAATDGYNYTVMNNDVYLYTGITSAVADESNIGFILTNMRTKDTHFYTVPGAEEYSAMASAEGQVQQMRYKSTFPLLINLNNKPTYFISLKDDAGLVKMYAFVDVADYQKVVVTDAAQGIEAAAKNYVGEAEVDFDDDNIVYKSITVSSITSSSINGNSFYYIEDNEGKRYRISITIDNKNLPFVQVDDKIKIGYLKEEAVTELIKFDVN